MSRIVHQSKIRRYYYHWKEAIDTLFSSLVSVMVDKAYRKNTWVVSIIGESETLTACARCWLQNWIVYGLMERCPPQGIPYWQRQNRWLCVNRYYLIYSCTRPGHQGHGCLPVILHCLICYVSVVPPKPKSSNRQPYPKSSNFQPPKSPHCKFVKLPAPPDCQIVSPAK